MKLFTKSVLALLGTLFWLTTTWLYATNSVLAHGSMEDPVSRVYHCFLEGPENPLSAACRAAVEAGGTQQFYDWNGVNLLAADQHRELIPDGQLCGAGKESHSGLDLARADWTAQPMAADANGNYEFVFLATAPHSTKYFDFYVTKDNYDPTQPLKWSDLEDAPFCHITSVTLQDGRYRMSCPLPPNKSGKHLIYNIWQRDDSAEAFYTCMDVEFTDAGMPSATPTPAGPTATPAPGSTPTPTPPPPTFTPIAPTQTAPSSASCQVDYTVTSDWGSGFNADIAVINNANVPINGWTLTWSFPGNQTVTSLWNGKVTQIGSGVLVNNENWNAQIGAGGEHVHVGFAASYSGANQSPAAFLLNGQLCRNGGAASTPIAPPSTATPSLPTPNATTPASTPTPTPKAKTYLPLVQR
ncbi:MAG: lytic polysaccharide monooxygenase [Caldilineaceae bacterium]